MGLLENWILRGDVIRLLLHLSFQRLQTSFHLLRKTSRLVKGSTKS